MSSMCPPLSEYRTVMVYDAGGWGHPPHQFIVTEQTRLVADNGLIATGCSQRQFDCVCDVRPFVG
jgi:hypothetical protein